MNTGLEILIFILILLNFRLLGSSRLSACIQSVAIQGVILGLTGFVLILPEPTILSVLVIAASTIVKAGVLPKLLQRTAEQVGVNREIEPLIGYSVSMLIGAVLACVSFLIAQSLDMPPGYENGSILIPAALFTIFTGLFLIVTRKKAITQVLAYLVMENGIYAFGLAFAHREPMLVELGVLLDVIVGVFIMGIAVFNISHELDHIDTDRLSSLKD